MYDKSNLVTDTYIIAINKKISTYGSFSYFNKKTANETLHLISPENMLNFLVNKDTIKNSWSFQLLGVNENVSKLKDKKIHDLSLTKLGKERKLQMQEPIETVIIWAQQSFEIAGGLNLVQLK